MYMYFIVHIITCKSDLQPSTAISNQSADKLVPHKLKLRGT